MTHYQQQQFSKLPFRGTIYKNKKQKFDIQRISAIDDLLTKNQAIYRNLRTKLQGIAKAERNITNNINTIRPISYMTSQTFNNSQQGYLNDTQSYYRQEERQQYESSPIGTQRVLNQTLKRRITDQNKKNLLMDTLTSLDYKISTHEIYMRQNSQIRNFKKEKQPENQNGSYGYLGKTNHYEHEDSFNSMNKVYRANSKNNSYAHLRQNSSNDFQKQKDDFYFINQSAPLDIDDIVKMNFQQLANRKGEIQTIYKQLRQEQQQIQKAYQDYKKGFNSLNVSSVGKQQHNTTNSPPKNSSPKKSFQKIKRHGESPSKMSSISKKDESQIRQLNFNNTSKTIDMNPTSQNMERSSSLQKSMSKYCTEEFESMQIPNKPQAMSAQSHIFVPFNKLYKSPIIQMKNQNTLILARQSKLLPQKSIQHKIVDGKKYKFSSNIQTDEQGLIKNVLKQDHNIVAIVGGAMTLKKKLHMAFIAHSFDKILKIIQSGRYNCLTVSANYCQFAEKIKNSQIKIQNSVQFTEETSIKVSILQIQRTIEQIYDTIKRQTTSMDSGYNKNLSSGSQKDRIKVVRFTRLTLLSGKQYIWSCQIVSANQFNFEFLKTIEVKDIIWSINPLVKNYDQVFRTLNEATAYTQAKKMV